MSKRENLLFLFDIYIAILKIKYYIKNIKSAEELKYNLMAWDAVIREFEIIGEATKTLIENKLFDNSKREIVDFRNVLIHRYFGIDEEEVWDIANSLDFFEKEIVDILKNYEIDFFVDNIILEYKEYDFIKNSILKLKE